MASPIASQKFRRALPVLTFVIGCFIAWFTWDVLSESRGKELRSTLQYESGVLTTIIENDINKRVSDIQRIVSRWKITGGTPQREFEADVSNYLDDRPGFQAIEWVDGDFIVRWVVPLAGNEKAVNLDLGFEERRRKSLNDAKDLKTVSVTKPINLVQGGKGILIYFPIYTGGEFDGFILAVFKTQEWLSSLVDSSFNASDFDISVLMAGDTIYQSDNYVGDANGKWVGNSVIDVSGNELVVSLRPKTQFFVHDGPYINPSIVGIIITFSLILSFLLFYLLKASLVSRQVQHANIVLEQESRERKKAEEIANDANEAKSKFLAAMSHEIRTPLNAVLGVLQLIDKPELPEDVRSKLKIAKQSGYFLMTLINQVLDFARIEAGAAEAHDEEFVISNLIDELYEMFLPQADKKGLNFDYKIIGDGDQIAFGDYSHIRQILFNLIGNAIKFTEEGSLKILVSIQEQSNDILELNFEVSDTGYGITEKEQLEIFDEFNQSEAGRKSGLGTGLGLSISKQLAELMDGKLTVESAIGRGTTFALNVDVQKITKSEVTGEQPAEDIEILPMKILIAEDNSVNQMIICEMLEQDGHTVVVASHGLEAVDAIRNAGPVMFDLVLMDIQMPVMDGMDATRAIRSVYPYPNVLPIIALTANAFKSQVERYLSVGMQDTLTKPVIRADLREAILKIQKMSGKDPFLANSLLSDIDPNDEYLDIVTLAPLTELLPREQFNLLVDSVMLTLSRTLPEIMRPDVSDERITSIAHEIRGMTANVGLSKLSKLASKIERLAIDGNDSLSDRMQIGKVSDESLNQLELFLEKRKIENLE